MAEIRKYNPAVGNAIAEALRAAMGDPFRPVEQQQAQAAGAPPAPATPDAPATTWISLTARPAEPSAAKSHPVDPTET